MNWHLEQIKAIEVELQSYYESDFDEEEKDYEINLRIKTSLANVLRSAKNELKGSEFESVKEKVLLVFSNNTGCMEDAEIFEKVSNDLITEDEKAKVLSTSAIGRWL